MYLLNHRIMVAEVRAGDEVPRVGVGGWVWGASRGVCGYVGEDFDVG